MEITKGLELNFSIPLCSSPEYSVLRQAQISTPDAGTATSQSKELATGDPALGQLQQHRCASSDGCSHILMPSQVPGSRFTYGPGAIGNSDSNTSAVHEISLQSRIEVSLVIISFQLLASCFSINHNGICPLLNKKAIKA